MPSVAPVLPAADLPVDLRRIELLCARLRPEEDVELEHIVWKIAKLPAPRAGTTSCGRSDRCGDGSSCSGSPGGRSPEHCSAAR